MVIFKKHSTRFYPHILPRKFFGIAIHTNLKQIISTKILPGLTIQPKKKNEK